MVWASIMINGHTRLHVVTNGTMTGQRYIDEVLLPHVRLFRGAVGDKFVFMDDNATCHRTLAVQDCLDSEGIQRLVWSARSPDLNPIENVWDALGRQVAGRNYPPTNKNTLIRAFTEEWDKLPQQLLDNVVQSMAVILAPDEGGVETSWNSAGGTDAGKAVRSAGAQIDAGEAIGIGKTVAVISCLCVGVFLCLLAIPESLFEVKYVPPTRKGRVMHNHFCSDVFGESILQLVQVTLRGVL
ncbi:transposable element Tc1 transposase [Trichonephila clavipes]|nr:transposable element Tc1 transposase [Trichonephila clavipes]